MVTSWLDDTARLLERGPFTECATHRYAHSTVSTIVHVAHRDLVVEVFDPEEYRDTEGYCTGDDNVSRSLWATGGWESVGTEIATAILESGDGLVLDFGAHIGWYTYVAAVLGHDVLAVDADAENLCVLAANVLRNGLGHRVHIAHGWIGDDTPTLPLPDEQVRLFKSDLEGNDFAAVLASWLLFYEQRVDYALIEVSPVFNQSYPGLMGFFQACGYRAQLLPGADMLDAVRADPLGYDFEPVDAMSVREPGFHQRDVLFTRAGL